ncbi:MAG: PQQ-dependent sugar dehydrogenase [Deltaproteobacteria bacterium]|nr:PQQ-dependent sugar dehydrogenase [Deltaproteobacteria bacterium]
MSHPLTPWSKSRNRKFVLVLFGAYVAVCPSLAGAVPNVQLEPVITGIDSPVAITHAGDGSGRLFITLQAGKILVYDGQQLLPAPFLDIGALITTGGERGLLSVAFHPDYPANGFLFVDYTDLNGDTVIARYSVSIDPNVVDPASAAILLAIPQPFANHNGGQLQFGPDGFLYIGMGDGGSGGDPLNNAQNLGSMLGKILRIDVDAGFPYGIPLDNPFIGNPNANPEIWALGLRNPWRFSFDRLLGDLLIADVGENSWEEVNFQQASSLGGENYGWRLMEGNHCFNPSTNCNDGSLTLPVIEYEHSLGNCSITGGYRYRGNLYPGLESVYFYADFCSGIIWEASRDASGAWISEQVLDTDLLITAFGENEDGELYLAHFSANGIIYKVTEPAAATSSGGGSGGGCFITSAEQF